MATRWSDEDAAALVASLAQDGVNADIALRVYTTRLLGSDPKLVLHGGGNTSVKTVVTDAAGDAVEVLCVKGSGWDMGTIAPAGLPAVRLAPLKKLRALDAMSDEDMVNAQRINLLDAGAPNPSVETLLHAFLPHKYIDHAHSTAVLSLIDQPDGAELARQVYGTRLAIVPYVMPGFALAKKVADVFDADPKVEGLILLGHGVFTMGDDARQAYDRMIAFVALAEERLARGRKARALAVPPGPLAEVAQIAPILRGALAIAHDRQSGAAKRQILEFRTGPALLDHVNGADVARYSQVGVATPDHTIRTKNWPLQVPAPQAGRLDEWAVAVGKAVDAYKARYHDYFARNNARVGGVKTELDPVPRVVLVPGLGLFGAGASAREAGIAADIAENTVAVIADAEAIGTFQSIPEADMFDMEYWSLEQAKLGRAAEKPLARQVAVITGGGSGIGAATARAFAAQGASVAVLDRDGAAARAVAAMIGTGALAVPCDVTDGAAVRDAFDRVARAFGGVDIVVSNAGAAWNGAIGTVAEETLRASFELNFWAHQRVAQAGLAIMRAQGTGGCLLFNVSKQAVNPGRDFGPYGLPKAALLALVKQYALDHGREGIRANGVNADRIRSGLLTDAMIATRAKARGVSQGDYMAGNLLGREVLAEDVAAAFVFLAGAPKTTAAILTVDGGNIEASLR